jgi:sugar phosphate isomerase/epimerase
MNTSTLALSLREETTAMADYSLAHLTAINLSPPELIRVAFRTGYKTVGLRLIAVTADSPGYPLMSDPALMRDTKAAIAETGVGVMDIEFVKITPVIDIPALEPFVATGAELGARYVITAPYDPDLARLADRLGAMSDLCSRHGMRAILEFFPWTDVPNLSAAAAVVAATNRPDCGILLDTLHYARSHSTSADFAGIPASRFPFVHVCDAPAGTSWTRAQLFHAGRVERLPPGEGGIDIKGILAHLPPGTPIALEVPMTAVAAVEGEEAVARRVRQAAERLLGS